MARKSRAAKASPHVVCTRITEKEWLAWKKAAGAKPLAEWIRDLCNSAARNSP
jgi:hypothetical protein